MVRGERAVKMFEVHRKQKGGQGINRYCTIGERWKDMAEGDRHFLTKY